MSKKFIMGFVTAVFMLMASITAFAGTWKQDSNGWWWDNGNGTRPVSAWQWCDGNGDGVSECYYFDENGYCLMNTTTPDGYAVNGDGAWIVDGVVQTQKETAQSVTAVSNTGMDRHYYLKMYYGLPGETIEQKAAKMTHVVYELQTSYMDLSYKPKTYTEIVQFLNETDWPNMSDYEKVEAAYKRCAAGFHGNHYGSDLTGEESRDIAKGIYEDPLLVYHCGGCAQFSGAMRILCMLMGMETGELGVNLHAQTMVKIDGEWWVINPSWANGEPMEKHMMLFDSDERREQWPLYNDPVSKGFCLDLGRSSLHTDEVDMEERAPMSFTITPEDYLSIPWC